MTLIEVITAFILLGVFLFGFSQVFMPVYIAWKQVTSEYYRAYALQFIAGSFRNECAKPEPNFENWKRIAAVVKELESCEISELRRGEKLRLMKAACVIAGERFEIMGLCTP